MKNPLEQYFAATAPQSTLAESSRYFTVKTVEIETAPGVTQRVLQRRILPPLPAEGVLADHVVKIGERLDLIAYEHLGDGRLYWQLADQNAVLHPEELIQYPGKSIGVPPSSSFF